MGLFDLGFAVKMLATEQVTLRHYLPDSYASNGVAYPRTVDTTATPMCSVQPIPDSQLKLVPEALHTSENWSIWSPVALAEGDLITRPNASVYKVFKLTDWSLAGTYWKALITKLAAGEGDG